MKVLGIVFAIMVVVFSNPQLEDSQGNFTSAADTEPSYRKSRLKATAWPYSREHYTDYGRLGPFDQSSELDNTVDQNTVYSGKDKYSGKKYLRQFEIMKYRAAPENAALRQNTTEALDPKDFVGPKVRTWTAKELFYTIRFRPDHPLITYIREAATQILVSVFTDLNWKNVVAAVPSPSGRKNWRLEELENYSLLPGVDEEFRAALDHSHQLLIDMQTTHPEADIQRVPVVVAALDISTWTKLAVKYGLKQPNISPFLQEKLERILEDMNARGAPNDEEITLVTTVGVIENNPEYFELKIPPRLLQILEANEQLLHAEESSSEEEIVDMDSPLIIPFDLDAEKISSQAVDLLPVDNLQYVDNFDNSENIDSSFEEIDNRKRRRN